MKNFEKSLIAFMQNEKLQKQLTGEEDMSCEFPKKKNTREQAQ
jgi:hypothetical protein